MTKKNYSNNNDFFIFVVALALISYFLWKYLSAPITIILNSFALGCVWIIAITVLFFFIKPLARIALFISLVATVGILFIEGYWNYPFVGYGRIGILNVVDGTFLSNFVIIWERLPTTNLLFEMIVPSIFYGSLIWLIVAFIIGTIILLTPRTAEEKLMQQGKDKKINMQEVLQMAEKTPFGSFILGGVLSGIKDKYFSVFEKDLNRHTCLIGTTGSGKTVTLYNYINNALKHNKPVIYITAKYDLDDIQKFSNYCKKYGRTPMIFTMSGENKYNPFATGTATEITDKIIGMFDFSEEHYKTASIRFLQLLLRLLQLKGIAINLQNIIHYSNLDNLSLTSVAPVQIENDDLPSFDAVETPKNSPKTDEEAIVYQRMKSIDEKAYSGFINRLAILGEGDLTRMLNDTHFCIDYAIENNMAVMFSLDSLAYQEQARQFGRLLINDIKPAVSHHQQRKGGAVGLFFDEFNVFASHEVVDVINKSRSANFQALLSFQSLSDIDRVDPNLTRQILQNCNTLIAHRQNEHQDSESIANTFGTFETVEKTYATDDRESRADKASMRKVREYIVHPDKIKSLEIGQAFIKSPEGMAKIQVLPC